MASSFLFYDLETFGADPRRSRIAQFAAVRTDADLEVVDEPASFFVKPADDLLPAPVATLVTGITPQQALREGVNEAAAFDRILAEMARPQTCTLGYNSIRFDDEFIRHGLFRNFHDPYAREWRGGNSRWDLLDVLRLVHALRPDGIVWPQREDGAASFKLEHLAEANHVRSGDAHEALSDVYATIAMARAVRTAQPRFWDYALRLRDKRFTARLLDPIAMRPVLHVSQRYPASRLCAAPVLPLATHPQIATRIVVFDLAADIAPLLELEPDAIADRLYVPAADLPEGVQRIALKEVHLNKAPALVAWGHLRPADFARLGWDAAAIQANADILRAHGPALAEKIRRVFSLPRGERAPADVDAALYDGFIGDGDQHALARVRGTPPALLGRTDFGFRDARLPELLFRYRARNWPDTLDAGEQQRWDDYRRLRLAAGSELSELGLAAYFEQIEQLRHGPDAPHPPAGHAGALLDQLEVWGRALQVQLGV